MTNSVLQNPTALDVLIVDLQGNLRGKRLPGSQIDKALAGATRLPLSTQLLDIWGDDVDHITQQGLSQGDPDGACIPHLATLKETPWRPGELQVVSTVQQSDGTAYFADSRAMLNTLDEKLTQRGLTAVVAVELEFYVLDASIRNTGIPTPPGELNIAGQAKQLQLYDLRVRDRLEPLIDRIERYAEALDIPVTTSLLEFGPGQVEINLAHRHTALQAADDAAMFKRLVDRAAFDEGFATTFMAKPYTDAAGSGMHTHVSLINNAGESIFDGSDSLLHCCSGVIKRLPEMLAVFAPHLNSWRRLQPDSFAPTRLDWGYDHRGVAIRIPEVAGSGARLEQRVAGADANPYLVLSLLLGAMLDGLDEGKLPEQPELKPGEPPSALNFTHDWITAINAFADSAFISEVLGEKFKNNYTKLKRHEAQKLLATVTELDWKTYLPQL